MWLIRCQGVYSTLCLLLACCYVGLNLADRLSFILSISHTLFCLLHVVTHASNRSVHRWRWSPTSWTISCVTSVRALAAEGSLPPSSALMLPVCSTIASSAGPTFTPALGESSTSPWSRREPTAHARSTSAGTRDETTVISTRSEARETQHRLADIRVLHGLSCSPKLSL